MADSCCFQRQPEYEVSTWLRHTTRSTRVIHGMCLAADGDGRSRPQPRMRPSSTSRSAAVFVTALALASFGGLRAAIASPQSGTAPGIGTWLQPGRGAQLVRTGSFAVALVRARDTANRLEWSGRSPAPQPVSRQPAARTAEAPTSKPRLPSTPANSATNGASDSRSRLLFGGGNDHRQRKRLPDVWVPHDPSHDCTSAGARWASSSPAIRLSAGEAVFHDAHAPPASEQSLDGRLS